MAHPFRTLYHWPVRATAALTVLLLLGGCVSAPGGFDSAVPAARLEAIADAARTSDRSAIPDLISMLQSDDPAVRMMSIRALEHLTGTTLGYCYAAPEWQRDEHIKAWAEWYRQHRSEIPAAPAAGGAFRPENSPSRGADEPISGVAA